VRPVLALLALIIGLCAVTTAAAQPSQGPFVLAELVGPSGVRPGETVWVGLRQRIRPGWHTYWRNPGDAGAATQIAWTLPPGWRAGDIEWPAPELIMVGPLANYAYSGEVLLPVAITAPADARPGETAALRAAAAWLVCEEVCVPEEAIVTLSLPVVRAPAGPAPDVAAWLRRIPRRSAAAAVLSPARNGRLQLAVAGRPFSLEALSTARFFPQESGVVDHAAPQPLERGPDGFTLTLTPAPDAPPPAELAGVITSSAGAFEVVARPGPLPVGTGGLGPVVRAGGGDGPALTLLPAVALALLGGLLLNLMPCVFPVLAIKAAHLLRHVEERPVARLGGLAYAAGVLATFAALAAAIIALQNAGEAVGWGFQLQAPVVVAALAVILLLAGLNLSGVFTLGERVRGAGEGLTRKPGVVGAFFTGVLAVVVAAPCTAPFMAGATGWALVQGPAEALAVFLALGVGLAAPFVLLSFSPRLLALLPKPGPWMIRLQRVLALPMYAAAVWLIWLAWRQTGDFGLAAVVAACLLAAVAAWQFGRTQRRGGWRVSPRPALIALAAALVVFPAIAAVAAAPRAAATRPAEGPLASQPWSNARVAALRAEGRPVFVNFTADWCVTCKVNERLALSDRRVAQALDDSNAAYLVADWTRRDPAIAQALAQHGRQGVPLYVVYRPDGEARVLPQLLTREAVLEALRPAGGSAPR